jgi:hypothetical protein
MTNSVKEDLGTKAIMGGFTDIHIGVSPDIVTVNLSNCVRPNISAQFLVIDNAVYFTAHPNPFPLPQNYGPVAKQKGIFTNLNFEQAITLAKKGFYISRDNGFNPGTYVKFIPSVTINKNFFPPHFELVGVGGTIAPTWGPTNPDMFANDWFASDGGRW